MDALRKFGLWAAIAISIPGAALALLVALPRIPFALMFGLDSFRVPLLYLIYFSGMAAGVFCVQALTDGLYSAGANYGRRAVVAILGTLAAAYLEYYFRNDRFPLIPAGYLAFTSMVWVVVTLTAWRQSQKAAAAGVV